MRRIHSQKVLERLEQVGVFAPGRMDVFRLGQEADIFVSPDVLLFENLFERPEVFPVHDQQLVLIKLDFDRNFWIQNRNPEATIVC